MVTRQVELTEEQNLTLERRAASEGRSVSDLIRASVDAVFREGDSNVVVEAKSAPHLSERESELLTMINRGLTAEVAERYQTLVSRRRAGTLTAEEHQELLRLTDQVERLQAERIEHLAELSRLQGKPLGVLMEELGLRPSPNV